MFVSLLRIRVSSVHQNIWSVVKNRLTTPILDRDVIRPTVGSPGGQVTPPLEGVIDQGVRFIANHLRGKRIERRTIRALGRGPPQLAKSSELRAATRLARLWHSHGKTVEGRDLLHPVYGWFTEGFDTSDLKEAKSLLDELF